MSFLALAVLMILSTAGACTAASAPAGAQPAVPATLLMDDPEADAPLLRGDWEEAARLHHALIKEQPDNGRAHYHLGYAWGQLGKFSEEIAAYQEAARLGVREGLLRSWSCYGDGLTRRSGGHAYASLSPYGTGRRGDESSSTVRGASARPDAGR